MIDDVEFLINLVATQFDSVTDADRVLISNWLFEEDRIQKLFLFVHQAHPTQEHVADAAQSLGVRMDSFPVAFLRKKITTEEFKIVAKSKGIDRIRSVVFLLMLFHIADLERKSLDAKCQTGECHHSWHGVEMRSRSQLDKALADLQV